MKTGYSISSHKRAFLNVSTENARKPRKSGTQRTLSETNPLSVQIGGGHYKDWEIQPVVFLLANSVPFVEGNIIKYVCRYKDKNGLEDLKKARHYLDILISRHENELSA